jgi:hypothetical protein
MQNIVIFNNLTDLLFSPSLIFLPPKVGSRQVSESDINVHASDRMNYSIEFALDLPVNILDHHSTGLFHNLVNNSSGYQQITSNGSRGVK